MQSEANSNFYQIFVREMNWKCPLRFFLGGGGRGAGEGGCLLFGIMICQAEFWYCAFLFLFPLCLSTLPVSSISKRNGRSYCCVLRLCRLVAKYFIIILCDQSLKPQIPLVVNIALSWNVIGSKKRRKCVFSSNLSLTL